LRLTADERRRTDELGHKKNQQAQNKHAEMRTARDSRPKTREVSRSQGYVEEEEDKVETELTKSNSRK